MFRKRYGITVQYYEDLKVLQNNRCAICNLTPPDGQVLVVDHDHETEQLRGLLCNKCNRGLGIFGDNVAGIRRALDYLIAAEAHTSG